MWGVDEGDWEWVGGELGVGGAEKNLAAGTDAKTCGKDERRKCRAADPAARRRNFELRRTRRPAACWVEVLI